MDKISEWIDAKVEKYIGNLMADFRENFEGMDKKDYEKAKEKLADSLEKQVHYLIEKSKTGGKDGTI